MVYLYRLDFFFLCLKKKENKIAIVVTNLGLEQRILWDKKKRNVRAI